MRILLTLFLAGTGSVLQAAPKPEVRDPDLTVSYRKTERTEIGAMLDRRRGNLDALVTDLRSAG